jgi:uncharacterized protein (DUF433 family)
MIDWQDRIVCDPDILFGKPRIRGTRIGVEFVLGRLASGWSEAQILESYPHVTLHDLQAVFGLRARLHEGRDLHHAGLGGDL